MTDVVGVVVPLCRRALQLVVPLPLALVGVLRRVYLRREFAPLLHCVSATETDLAQVLGTYRFLRYQFVWPI